MTDDPNAMVPLPGSERAPLPNATRVGPVEAGATATVTVVLRPAGGALAPLVTGDRRAVRAGRSASPDDVAAVGDFARSHGLEVRAVDLVARSVALTGDATAMARAFGADLGVYECEGATYRGRTGALHVPASLADAIVAVLGLDDRPQAQPHFRILAPTEAPPGAFTPVEIARLYDFPTDLDGAGQRVAIIELGGGYDVDDLTAYFNGLGLPVPTVTAVSVDGAANDPSGDPNSADGEVALDIEVVGAMAPGTAIEVYFAPNTTSGFYDAIAAALHREDTPPCAVSISWGGAESTWTPSSLDAYDALFADAAALGVVVTAAAGDGGSADRVDDGRAHADFPSSSPNVLACGGTRLSADGTTITAEVVWNEGSGGGATGGGVSDHFALPDYQRDAGVPPSANGGGSGRGVPDVAGDADPNTGYMVRVGGKDLVFGGTSAVAPLWAALVALAAQRAAGPVGFLHPFLYGQAHTSVCRDVTEGDNGAYRAGPAWDACTGWGSPRGAAFVAAVSSR
jgi:kumamolisin